MTRGGEAFELPTPERLTSARGSSSSPNLPTPHSNASTGPGRQGRQGGMNLQTAMSLLPTPAVNDMGAGKTPQQWDEWTAKMHAKHANGN